MKKDSNMELFLTVKMLGEFSIESALGKIHDADGRSRKVWNLISYLLINRQHSVSTDKIIEDIWGDDGSDDPLNVLKNLIYRARIVLKEICPEREQVFINYKNGTYSWNNDVKCSVDIEIFEACVLQSEDLKLSNEKRLNKALEAIALYGGDFLSQYTYNDWVISKNTYYTSLYLKVLLTAGTLLHDMGRDEEIIKICEHAVQKYMFEENIHEELLKAYVACGRYSKALAHYNYISELFFTELGVSMSEHLKDLYKNIMGNVSEVEKDISAICEDMGEEVVKKGAFYCNYEVFKNIYRIQARSIQRSGQSIHVVLFTISNSNENMKSVMTKFKKNAMTCLRQGDVLARFSSNQFVLMLPMTTMENAQMVSNRILAQITRSLQNKRQKITINIRPLSPIDSSLSSI